MMDFCKIYLLLFQGLGAFSKKIKCIQDDSVEEVVDEEKVANEEEVVHEEKVADEELNEFLQSQIPAIVTQEYQANYEEIDIDEILKTLESEIDGDKGSDASAAIPKVNVISNVQVKPPIYQPQDIVIVVGDNLNPDGGSSSSSSNKVDKIDFQNIVDDVIGDNQNQILLYDEVSNVEIDMQNVEIVNNGEQDGLYRIIVTDNEEQTQNLRGVDNGPWVMF